MADYHHDLGLGNHLLHAVARLGVKCKVAGAEHFIHEKDFRLNRGGDGEGQAHEHSGGVKADRDVKVSSQLAEIGDFRQLGPNAARRLALEIAPVINVLATASFHFKAQAQFKQRADAALDRAATARGRIDARQKAQQRALPRAIAAQNANSVTFTEAQTYIVQRPYFHHRVYRFAKHSFQQIFLERDLILFTDSEDHANPVQINTRHFTGSSHGHK